MEKRKNHFKIDLSTRYIHPFCNTPHYFNSFLIISFLKKKLNKTRHSIHEIVQRTQRMHFGYTLISTRFHFRTFSSFIRFTPIALYSSYEFQIKTMNSNLEDKTHTSKI